VRLGFLLVMVGCKFSASSKVDGIDTSIPSGDMNFDDTGAADTGDEPDTDTGEDGDPEEWDDDGDGYTEAEGDCDDDDDTIRPGLPDRCDGIDNDCDGAIDEDAAEEDPYEPNDAIPWDLGQTEKGEPIEVEGFLFDEDDVDMFKFQFEDGWGVDELTVVLSDLSPDIAYKFEIIDLDDGAEELFEDFSTSVDESITFELDGGIGDDDVELQVTISSLGGAGCTTPYRLTINHDGWF